MPALAELVPLIVALLALLLMYALYLFGKVIAHIFPGKIGVGPVSINPRSWVEDGVDGLMSGIKWLVGDVIRPLVSFIMKPFTALWNLYDAIMSGISYAADAVDWIRTVAIPDAIHIARLAANAARAAAEHYAHELYLDARTYAHSLYDAVHKYAHDIVVDARNYALSIVNKARDYALNLHRIAESYALSIVNKARAYSLSLYHTAQADISRAVSNAEAVARAGDALVKSYAASQAAQALSTAEGYADKAIAGVIGKDVSTAVGAVDGLWSGLITDVGALQDVIATDLPDIGAAVNAIPRAIPRDLASALTGTLALSIPMLRYMRECGIPNCRNLSKYGRDLQDLLHAVEAGGLMALFAAMVTDPRGTANTVDVILSPIVSGAGNAARDILRAA